MFELRTKLKKNETKKFVNIKIVKWDIRRRPDLVKPAANTVDLLIIHNHIFDRQV